MHQERDGAEAAAMGGDRGGGGGGGGGDSMGSRMMVMDTGGGFGDDADDDEATMLAQALALSQVMAGQPVFKVLKLAFQVAGRILVHVHTLVLQPRHVSISLLKLAFKVCSVFSYICTPIHSASQECSSADTAAGGGGGGIGSGSGGRCDGGGGSGGGGGGGIGDGAAAAADDDDDDEDDEDDEDILLAKAMALSMSAAADQAATDNQAAIDNQAAAAATAAAGGGAAAAAAGGGGGSDGASGVAILPGTGDETGEVPRGGGDPVGTPASTETENLEMGNSATSEKEADMTGGGETAGAPGSVASAAVPQEQERQRDQPVGGVGEPETGGHCHCAEWTRGVLDANATVLFEFQRSSASMYFVEEQNLIARMNLEAACLGVEEGDSQVFEYGNLLPDPDA
jgi:hypothetical protein